MITRRILLAGLVIGSIALYSCGDDSNPASGSNRVILMPNEVGMLWNYEVLDSLAMTTDTVSVSVVDSNVFNFGGLVWTSLRHSDNYVSGRVVIARGNRLDFLLDATLIGFITERFVFPLSLGNQWSIPRRLPETDSSEVTSIGTVVVPAGQFPNSALIERNWNIGFEGGRDSSQTWIAPTVGIVSRYFHSTRGIGDGTTQVTRNETWELIDYDLSTFLINQFPGAIGSEWVYEIIDSRFASPDTATVSVFKSVEISGFDSTKMWLIQGSLISDTQYVAYVNNQVWVSGDTLLSSLFDWRYEFPLAVGRGWGLPGAFLGIPIIKAKVAITTPAGEFPSAFHYTMSGGGFNVAWGVEDWLVPEVGVVKRSYGIVDFAPGYTQEWTLLSYDLK